MSSDSVFERAGLFSVITRAPAAVSTNSTRYYRGQMNNSSTITTMMTTAADGSSNSSSAAGNNYATASSSPALSSSSSNYDGSIPSHFTSPMGTTTTTTITTTTTVMTTYPNQHAFNSITIAILSGLLVFLAILVVLIALKLVQQKQERQRAAHAAALAAAATMDQANAMTELQSQELQERILRRYETIEHWLITKKVQTHDSFCKRVVRGIIPQSPSQSPPKQCTSPVCQSHHHDAENNNHENPTNNHNSTIPEGNDTPNHECPNSNDQDPDLEQGPDPSNPTILPEVASAAAKTAAPTQVNGCCSCSPLSSSSKKEIHPDTNTNATETAADGEERECPICMNALRVGDYVSWSANVSCTHVYHHECIKEWLLRRTGCPFCRAVVLPCDEVRGEKKQDELRDMSKRYASRSSTMYYCQTEGLVALPAMVRCTLKELEELKKRIFDSAIRPEELVTLRGERREASTSSLHKDDALFELTNSNNNSNGQHQIDMNRIEDPSENPCFDVDEIEGTEVEIVDEEEGGAQVETHGNGIADLEESSSSSSYLSVSHGSASSSATARGAAQPRPEPLHESWLSLSCSVSSLGVIPGCEDEDDDDEDSDYNYVAGKTRSTLPQIAENHATCLMHASQRQQPPHYECFPGGDCNPHHDSLRHPGVEHMVEV